MPTPERARLRAFIGSEIHVDLSNGNDIEGRLLNVNANSLWLLDGDIDRFIPLDAVARCRAR